MDDEYLEMAAALAAPAPRSKTNREFAGTILLPDGPQAGERYEPDSEPAQSVMFDAMDGKILNSQGLPFRDLVYVAATQVGKSLTAILVPSMAAICADEAVIYCLPTGDLISKVWTTKLLPSIRGCGLGDWLPDTGPGARGGKPTALVMKHPDTGRRAGAIIFMAGGEGKKREVGQAGVTARTVLIDEADEYEDSHRVALIRQRAASFGRDAVTITASTVKKDVGSVILALYKDSTASRLWFACPHCRRFQPLEWDQVRYDGADDPAAMESARYYCPHCAAGWTEAERHLALQSYRLVHDGQAVDESGAIVGALPRTHSFGLRCGKLDYHLGLGLGDLAVEHRRAKARMDTTNDHGLMRSFYRDRLSREYVGDVNGEDAPPQQLTRAWLVARSAGSDFALAPITREKGGDSAYCAAECPPGPEALFLGVDVQRGGKEAPGRLYYVLMGVASDFRTWDLAYGSHILAPVGIQPTEAELHKGLDWLHEYSASLAGQYGRPIVRRLVDIGDRQEEIRRWQMRHAKDWWCVKGVAPGMKATDAFDLQDWVYKRKMDGGRWYAYEVDVQLVRFQAQAQYLVPAGKPGAAMLPRGVGGTDSLIKHYCATALIPDGRGGTRWSGKAEDRKYHFEFQFRHDLLDCRTYALALAKRWLRDLERKRSFDEYQKGAGGNEPGSWLGEVLNDVA